MQFIGGFGGFYKPLVGIFFINSMMFGEYFGQLLTPRRCVLSFGEWWNRHCNVIYLIRSKCLIISESWEISRYPTRNYKRRFFLWWQEGFLLYKGRLIDFWKEKIQTQVGGLVFLRANNVVICTKEVVPIQMFICITTQTQHSYHTTKTLDN